MRKKPGKPIIAQFGDGTTVTIENPHGKNRAVIFKQWCERNNVAPFAILR